MARPPFHDIVGVLDDVTSALEAEASDSDHGEGGVTESGISMEQVAQGQ